LDGLATTVQKAKPGSLAAVATNENNIAIDLGSLVKQCRKNPNYSFDHARWGKRAAAQNINNIRITGIKKVCDALRQKNYY